VAASSHIAEVRFDARGLVANAGLVLPATLVSRVRNSPTYCGSGRRYERQGARPFVVMHLQMHSSSFHPFLRLDAQTGSLRLPATICSTNF
jgi:hypothetical protein